MPVSLGAISKVLWCAINSAAAAAATRRCCTFSRSRNKTYISIKFFFHFTFFLCENLTCRSFCERRLRWKRFPDSRIVRTSCLSSSLSLTRQLTCDYDKQKGCFSCDFSFYRRILQSPAQNSWTRNGLTALKVNETFTPPPQTIS